MDAATSRVTFQGENHTLPLNQSKLITYQNFFFNGASKGTQIAWPCCVMTCLLLSFSLLHFPPQIF